MKRGSRGEDGRAVAVGIGSIEEDGEGGRKCKRKRENAELIECREFALHD